ncbi:hypothetical protein [Streptomyces kronopolitis]|uniref:hypothetical protein n=1 Tax=Streptomyces kronopolitis TaxID=1612435 RepID=UPI003D979ECB
MPLSTHIKKAGGAASQMRPSKLLLRLYLRQLQNGPTARYNSVAAGAAVVGGSGVQLAAFGTSGLETFLKGDALQVGILIAGLVILFGAKKKDWSGTLIVGGIALVGLAVMGLSGKGINVGNFLAGWIWTDKA